MLGFLKKKKAAEPEKKKISITTTFKSIVNDTPPEYDPWDSSKGNADNEYANAVFIHMHSKPTPLPENPDGYPRYVSYDLGIHNPLKKFKELLAAGYLEKASAADVLATYRQAELKEVLAANNLPTTGRKNAELLERIMTSLNVEELGLPVKYIISAKGVEYVDQHKDMLMLFRNPYNISYEEYASVKSNSSPYLKFNDIIWAVFNERSMEIPLHHNGGRRNNALHRAMFLKTENRMVDSLDQYITVLYYDVNDYIIREEHHVEFLKKYGEKDDEKRPSFFLVPVVRDAIFDSKDLFREEMIERAFDNYVDPSPKISEDIFRQMVFDIMEGKEFNLDNYYKIKK